MKQHFNFMPRVLSLTVALLLGLSAVVHAQEITGNIVGTVKDSSGAAVKGATVTITDDDKSLVVRTIETGDEGEFAAPQLPRGSGRYVAGWYAERGSRMYVSRGIGTSVLPIRFRCAPELPIITVGMKFEEA